MEGLIVTDREDLWPRAEQEMSGLIAEGSLRVLEQVHDGLSAALVGLLAGADTGKQLVRVAPDPPAVRS